MLADLYLAKWRRMKFHLRHLIETHRYSTLEAARGVLRQWGDWLSGIFFRGGYKLRITRRIRKAAILLCCIALFAGILPLGQGWNSLRAEAANKQMKMSTKELTLKRGSTTTLSMENVKKDATIEWKSSNNKIVEIADNRGITTTVRAKGVRKGTAVITATVSGRSFSCKVTVKGSALVAADIYLTEGTSYYVLQEAYRSRSLSYADSSNSTVATVNSKGKVTAKQPGKTTVELLHDGEILECNVYVLPKTTPNEELDSTSTQILSDKEDYREFSLDGTVWKKKLTGLKPDTEYTVYYRVAATRTAKATKAKKAVVRTKAAYRSTAIPEGIQYSMEFKPYSYDGVTGGKHYSHSDSIFYYLDSAGQKHMVAYDEQALFDNTYTPDFTWVSEKKIKLSHSEWGGFYAGEDGYFYVATGENNMEEDDSATVFCIEKYNKNWKKVGKTEITGKDCERVTPYRGGRCDMLLVGDTLLFYACGERYLTGDGYHHQRNYFATIRTSDMSLLYAKDNAQIKVSHSFAQYLRKDADGRVLFLDHGDGEPRSVVLQTLSDVTDWSCPFDYSLRQELSLFDLFGEIGENYTGTTVNGLETGSEGSVVAGKSVPHGQAVHGVTGYDSEYVQNIYLATADSQGKTGKFTWLTDYSVDGLWVVGEPRLVKLSEDRFAVLYEVYKRNEWESKIWDWRSYRDVKMCCTIVDSSGAVIAEKYYPMYFSSGGQPLVEGGKISWIGYDKMEGNYLRQPKWYQIDLRKYLTNTAP